ncbi:SIKE family protein [Paenibacillus sp. ALJ109b]|uniref:SIKE family protein n=1 Tax=Paenibacillus sp. ALJ109b TaxID=2709068 RepID=UPI0013D4E247|nr:SIKE family protein [Paenibacillus sp. ALJ109b]NEU59964.1 SIKE family protein [Paenibacillus sp. ALJ109b]
MRRFVLMFIFAFALAACDNSDEDLPVTQDDQGIQDLQAENKQLKAELEAAQNTLNEMDMSTVRGPLNAAFRIIDAMNNKDYKALATLSVPEVAWDNQDDTYTLHDDESKQNVSLLSPIGLGNLEYRGFDPVSENEVQLFLAKVDDGNVAIYIDFVKTGDQWLYKGHLTN